MSRPVQTGDLAVIVNARGRFAENNGAIVEVGPAVLPGQIGPQGAPVRPSKYPGPIYRVYSKGRALVAALDRRSAFGTLRQRNYVYSREKVVTGAKLVPILPDAGQDQTLSWVPVPSPKEVPTMQPAE